MQTSKFSRMAMMNQKTQFKALCQFTSKLFSWSKNSSATRRSISNSDATRTAAPRTALVNPKLLTREDIDGILFFPSRLLQLSPENLNLNVSRNPIVFQDLCSFPTMIEPQYKKGYKSVDAYVDKMGLLNEVSTEVVVQRSKIDEVIGNAGRLFRMDYCKKDSTLLPNEFELACKFVDDTGEMILLRARGAKGGDKSFTFLKTLRYKTAGVEGGSSEGDDKPAPPPPASAPAIDKDEKEKKVEVEDDDDDDVDILSPIPEVDDENDSSDDTSAPAKNTQAPAANEKEKEKYTIYYSDNDDEDSCPKKRQKRCDDSDEDHPGSGDDSDEDDDIF